MCVCVFPGHKHDIHTQMLTLCRSGVCNLIHNRLTVCVHVIVPTQQELHLTPPVYSAELGFL